MLAAVAVARGEFYGSALAEQLQRSPAQVMRELDKLFELGAILEVDTVGMRRPFIRANTSLAQTLFVLPALIELRFGPHPARGSGEGRTD